MVFCACFHSCGPCLRIAPAFNALSNKYPQATFLEVDVHQCQVGIQTRVFSSKRRSRQGSEWETEGKAFSPLSAVAVDAFAESQIAVL